MKHLIYCIQIFVLLIFLSCNDNQDTLVENHISIIPEPVDLNIGENYFTINAKTCLVSANEDHQEIFTLLAQRLNKSAGFNLTIKSSAPKSNYIIFKEDQQLDKEAYRLNIQTDFIEIEASNNTGFLYGLQTLRQLLPPEIESQNQHPGVEWVIPTLEIYDHPRYPWRGLMLDVSRHFFEKEYILSTLDRMAFFKLNVLHLHLVDDQGWRIEINKYPKLTEVGAFRVDQEDKHWDARSKNLPNEKATYGGFYTQEEIKEIVNYASELGITVVPEIEMPAHTMSALAAYPEFSCSGEAIAVPSGGVWPITDIYCAGKEETFKFLEDVLDEVMSLFPSKYIHVGGDEATRTNWEKCTHCQKRMKENGLENTAQLQSYFIKRMERFINSRNRVLLGWDEILEGGLAPNATVMSWRGYRGGWEASELGFDVVMTPGDYTYFNQYQGDPDYEPIAFGGYVPLSKVYDFDPILDSMSSEQKKHILGGQANLWSEFITDEQQSEYMLYPRLAALSEVLWTTKDRKSWSHFSEKIPVLFKRFGMMGVKYSRSVYAVTVQSDLGNDGTISVTLNNEFPDSRIQFELNDSKLNSSSQEYAGPIEMSHTTTIKTAVFEEGKTMGDTLVKTFNFHKAIGKPVNYEPIYSEQYQGTGEENLVNVLRGSKNFHDGQWQAWLSEQAEITIDLLEKTEVSSVLVGSMENQGSGIYFPRKMEVDVSNNGTDFNRVGEINNPFKDNGYVTLKDFKILFESQEIRWIKLRLTNLSSPPQGGGAWMFFDEVVVE